MESIIYNVNQMNKISVTSLIYACQKPSLYEWTQDWICILLYTVNFNELSKFCLLLTCYDVIYLLLLDKH